MNHRDVSREVFNAHLTLQGWRPVRTIAADGVYNDALGIGFGIILRIDLVIHRPDHMGGIVRIGGSPAKDIEWTDIPDNALYKIMERLEAV